MSCFYFLLCWKRERERERERNVCNGSLFSSFMRALSQDARVELSIDLFVSCHESVIFAHATLIIAVITAIVAFDDDGLCWQAR